MVHHAARTRTTDDCREAVPLVAAASGPAVSWRCTNAAASAAPALTAALAIAVVPALILVVPAVLPWWPQGGKPVQHIADNTGSLRKAAALQGNVATLPRPPGCVCNWILHDDCVNTDACTCFCRAQHPEGPCTVSVPQCNGGEQMRPNRYEPADKRASSRLPGSNIPFFGVNLGGWLVLEDWLWGSEMMDKHIEDEWTLVKVHGGPLDQRAIQLIRSHWETFVSESDLDRLKSFGVSHVRIPIGWWLVDYDAADGFVDGGKHYLSRVLHWLQLRGMHALLDLHAVPCAQAEKASFTGKKRPMPFFFADRACYGRGMHAMRELAKLIVVFEKDVRTAGVVMGMELLNEPDWSSWLSSPGIQELYETMVPELRRILPANHYAIYLFFWDLPDAYGAQWLAGKQAADPDTWGNVVYDLHLYHSYGDDNAPGRKWSHDVDSCKTCCRDRLLLANLVASNVTVAIGEYGLNTGFAEGPDFQHQYMKLQLSLWKHLGAAGSFFWNHRVLYGKSGYFREMSLLDMMSPGGPLPPVQELRMPTFCSGYNLSRCPSFDRRYVGRKADCAWQGGTA